MNTTQKETSTLQPETSKYDSLLEGIMEGNPRKTILSNLNKIAFHEFVPWLDPQKQANKRYFAKKGGLTRCLEIVQSSKVEIRKSMKMAAAYVIWNFCEIKELINYIWKYNLFGSLVELLLSNDASIVDVAVGIFMVVLEYDRLDYVVENYLDVVIPNIIQLTKKTDEKTATFTILTQASAVHSMCMHPIMGRELLRQGVLAFICSKQVQDTLAPRYMGCLSISHLALHNLEALMSHGEYDSLGYVKKMVDEVTPEELYQFENESNFSWNSLVPFYVLTQARHKDVMLFSLLCLTNLSFAEHNIKLFEQENLVESIICLQWLNDENTKQYTNKIIANLKNYSAPSLFRICEFNILYRYLDKKNDYENFMNRSI